MLCVPRAIILHLPCNLRVQKGVQMCVSVCTNYLGVEFNLITNPYAIEVFEKRKDMERKKYSLE